MAKTVGNTTGQPQDITVATGNGASDGDTQRIVTASDSPEVTALQIIDDWDDVDAARVTFSRTRVAGTPTIDTAVYADLDRLGSVVTITGAGRANGRSGMIVGAMLADDAGSNFSIEAWFFQVTPTMANADNGIFSLTDANMATAVPLGVIDFWSANSKSYTDGRICPGTYMGGPCAMHYTCAAGDSAIYMILRARGAYDAAATDDLVIGLELLRY